MELSSRGLLLTVVVTANLFVCVCGILQIDNCINDKISITTDTNSPTDIKCSGLPTYNYSVVWEVFYPVSVNKATVPLATCSPSSCSNVRSDVMASGGSDFSILQIVHNHTQLFSGGRVRCNVSPNEQPSCAVEIIAALPALTVTINGAEADLQVGSMTTLRCRPGTTSIPETSLSYAWSGLACDISVTSPYICQFTAQAEHNMRVVTCVVTYKDYPNIPGKSATVTLKVATSVTASPTTGAPTGSVTTTTQVTASTVSGGSQTPWGSSSLTSSETTVGGAEPQKANVGAIVGGVIGAVVAIAVVVVVLVFIIKRRKSRPKPPPASRRADTEDHINPVYGTDDPSSPSSSSPTTHNTPSSNGIYSAVGDDEVPESSYVIPDSGVETPEAGYAAVDIRGGRHPSTKPTAVVSAYEPVNEGKGAGKPPTHPKSYGGSSDYYSTVGGAAAGVNLMQPPAMAASDEYAVVDKPKKSKKKGALHAQIPLDAEYAVVNKTMKTQSTAATAHPQDEYAVVDKSRKSQPAAAASGDEYAVVDKSRTKPAAKPKPGVKPKPTANLATKPDDGQYNALNFQASQPSPDVEQNYSHLDDVRSGSDADSQSSRL